MSERPTKKAKVNGRSRARRGISSMTAGPNSTLTATARFNTFSGGDYRKGTSVLYHAKDDEKASETLSTTQTPVRLTDQSHGMGAYNDPHLEADQLEADMDHYGPDDDVLPSNPRRAKKVGPERTPRTRH